MGKQDAFTGNFYQAKGRTQLTVTLAYHTAHHQILHADNAPVAVIHFGQTTGVRQHIGARHSTEQATPVQVSPDNGANILSQRRALHHNWRNSDTRRIINTASNFYTQLSQCRERHKNYQKNNSTNSF